MIKNNYVNNLQRELKEKLQEIKDLDAEVKDLQVEIKNNSFNPIEGFFDSNVINKFKIKYCRADNLIENVPILSDQISILKDSLYNYKKQKYIFYTNKEIKNMKYYYEIIYSTNGLFEYHDLLTEGDANANPIGIIGLAKYTLIKDKSGKNIRVFKYSENFDEPNLGFIDKDILKLVITFPEESFKTMANFILKYIKKDSEKINILNKIANNSHNPYDECYSAFIFDKNSYDLDKDFEDPERFKKILKETIVNFTKDKNINLVSFVNKEDVPFNLDFHLMVS
jgi:hypothetical protein